MNADRSTRRRTRRFGVSILLVVGALLALGASSALADAGNPIVGTTKADLVQNPNGTVTVYVRGQWNWLSHKSDCNFDRAATGLSMIWNDSTETGYTLNGKTVSAQVGVATKDKSWEDPNPIDGMVHPVDRGNIPEGLPGVTNPPFKVEQTFSDPAPQAAGETHPTANWRGGCGREPLTHVDAYTNFPWGSWGYEKALESKGTDGNFHQGYSHVYRSRDFVPKSVCVNFYDVHDSGFQVPNNSASLDVLANDDNSIEENDFAVNGGSCVHFVKIKTKATASASLGEPITDTATITDAVTNKTSASDGTITFSAFKDPSTCIGKADFTSGPTAVDLDKSTEVTSEPFSPTSIGTYHWIATFHSTADPQATDITTTCKEAEESSVVGPATPTLATTASNGVANGTQVFDKAHVSGGAKPTGTVTFRFYALADAACASPLFTDENRPLDANGDATSETHTIANAGTYRWIATYNGDANNKSVSGLCTEPNPTDNETSKVEKATPTLATTASNGVANGTQVFDKAHVSGGAKPTGTVTFRFYALADAACASPLFTDENRPLDANGDATSETHTIANAGTYRWIATYNGDANNKSVSGLCTEPNPTDNETSKVEKATPTLATTASNGVANGTQVFDKAHVSGGAKPTGTVTFRFYALADAACASPLFTDENRPLDANGDATSETHTIANAGTYRWIATYNGDANNKSVSGLCTEPNPTDNETSKVEKATPTLATTASNGVANGTQVFDKAHVSGGAKPTGTVTFRFYALADAACASPLFTDENRPLDANGDATSETHTIANAGTYRWIATYNGDANNKSVSGLCTEPNPTDHETSVVEKASPQITTDAGPGTVLGGQVTDTAHLSGGAAPTGSITFRLYNNPNCAGTPAAEVTNGSVNGNGDYSSPPATPAAAGEYFWVAIYSGDANNKGAQTGCSDPTEKVTITNPPAGEVAASKIPPPECKLRKARARFFIYTRHNRVRLVIRYVAYTKATITTSFVMHGRKGNLNLGKATKTFKKKGVFRLPKHLTPAKMKKIRAATDFGVQFQIPGTPAFCQAYFKRTLTVARFVEGQKVWFQTGSVFGGDV